jgi:hypothetical protein
MKKSINFFIACFLLILSSLIFSGCTLGKYEGRGAEEWADEYYQSEAEKQECVSQLDYYEMVIDEDLLELGECIDDSKTLISNLLKRCSEIEGYTEVECIFALAEQLESLQNECVINYMKN